MKLMSVPLILILTIITSKLFAQDSALRDLTQNLDDKKIEIEQSLKPMLDEKAALEEQQVLLGKRISEIETEKTKALTQVEQPVAQQTLEDILLKEQNLGKCKVIKGQQAGEFYIEQGSNRIRFQFAAPEANKMATARLVTASTGNYIEVQQENVIENNLTKSLFKTTLRFEVGTQKMLHAVFTGESVNDGFFGWSSSRAPKILSCILE